MLDVSSARVEKVIVHQIGNKLREEGFRLSSQEATLTDDLKDLLLQKYLLPLAQSKSSYSFSHESDISLNELYSFSSKIFDDSLKFSEQTQSIAKHLYSVSLHPNISGGELIVILFSSIFLDSMHVQGLGILRIEDKEEYLDVNDEGGVLQIVEKQGISLSRIQKGALILSQDKLVLAIDNLSQKSKYWLDAFLRVSLNKNATAYAKVGSTILKAISSNLVDPNKSPEFNNIIQSQLTQNDTVSIKQLREISETFLPQDKVSEVFQNVEKKVGFEIGDDIEIKSSELKRQTKNITNQTKIGDGVSLLITNPKIKVTEFQITKIGNKTRAIIELDI